MRKARSRAPNIVKKLQSDTKVKIFLQKIANGKNDFFCKVKIFLCRKLRNCEFFQISENYANSDLVKIAKAKAKGKHTHFFAKRIFCTSENSHC